MTAVEDRGPDLVERELGGTIAHAVVQERLTDFDGHLQADELDLIPHAEVRGRIAGRIESC
jgi:hypothetical protein